MNYPRGLSPGRQDVADATRIQITLRSRCGWTRGCRCSPCWRCPLPHWSCGHPATGRGPASVVQAALWAFFVVLTVVEIVARAGADSRPEGGRGRGARALEPVGACRRSGPCSPCVRCATCGSARVLSADAAEAVQREVFSPRGLGAARAAVGLFVLVARVALRGRRDRSEPDRRRRRLVRDRHGGDRRLRRHRSVDVRWPRDRDRADDRRHSLRRTLTGALAERFISATNARPSLDDRIDEMAAQLDRMEATLRSGRPD